MPTDNKELMAHHPAFNFPDYSLFAIWQMVSGSGC
jgi:hypothetical protein